MRCHSDDSLSSSAASTTKWQSNLNKNDSANHFLALARALASREQDMDILRSENRKLHDKCEALRNENRALLATFITESCTNEMKTPTDDEEVLLYADEQSHDSSKSYRKQRQQDTILFEPTSIGKMMQQEYHSLIFDSIPSDNEENLVAPTGNVLGLLKSSEELFVDSISRKVKESIENELWILKEDVAFMLSSLKQLKAEIVQELKNITEASGVSVKFGKDKSKNLEATMTTIASELEIQVPYAEKCVQTSPSSTKEDVSSLIDTILTNSEMLFDDSASIQDGKSAFSDISADSLRCDSFGVNEKIGTVVAATDARHYQEERQTSVTEKTLSQIAASVDHSLALVNGTVKAWGLNDKGQALVPADLKEVKSIAAGEKCSMALKRDGTVVLWGDGTSKTIQDAPRGLSEVEAIAAGRDHALALLANKTVVAWGSSDQGLNLIPASVLENEVKSIAAGPCHSLAVLSSGKVVCWGLNNLGQTNVPKDLDNVKSVAAGYYHSIALKNDGTMVGWGSGKGSQIPSGLRQVKAIASGCYQNLALLENGFVKAWGINNYFHQTCFPSNLESVVEIAAGGDHFLAMKADGTVVGWGMNNHNQVAIPDDLKN